MDLVTPFQGLSKGLRAFHKALVRLFKGLREFICPWNSFFSALDKHYAALVRPFKAIKGVSGH